MGAMDGVINVKMDFGALGVMQLEDGTPVDDGPRIQEAIDAAFDRALLHTVDDQDRDFNERKGGATIYFPSGIYPVRENPLILPRFPSAPQPVRTIVFKGAGWMNTVISNLQSAPSPAGDPAGDAAPSPLFQGDENERFVPRTPPKFQAPRGQELIETSPTFEENLLEPPLESQFYGNEGIGYIFQDLQLGAAEGHSVFKWDVPVQVGDRRSESHRMLVAYFNHVYFRGVRPRVCRSQPTGLDYEVPEEAEALVYINRGRVFFSECMFTLQQPGDHKVLGVSVQLVNSSGSTMANCKTVYGRGALLDVTLGANYLVLNCRSEGAVGRPAWRFAHATNVTMINADNEGHFEWPSIFLFDDCDDVVLLNPSVATGKSFQELISLLFGHVALPFGGDSYADGIRFENCRNCHITSATVGRDFAELGDRTAHLIRIRNSNYITARGLRTTTRPGHRDIDIDTASKFCCLEIFDGDEVFEVGAAGRAVPLPSDCTVSDREFFLWPFLGGPRRW